jgi:galactokinase
LSALDISEDAEFDLPAEKPIKNQHWANYLIGVVNKLGAKSKIESEASRGKSRGALAKASGFNLTFAGDVPPGAGLSSSAALRKIMASPCGPPGLRG